MHKVPAIAGASVVALALLFGAFAYCAPAPCAPLPCAGVVPGPAERAAFF